MVQYAGQKKVQKLGFLYLVNTYKEDTGEKPATKTVYDEAGYSKQQGIALLKEMADEGLLVISDRKVDITAEGLAYLNLPYVALASTDK